MKITARTHMFCWRPQTDHVALIPWPDRIGRSNAYCMSTLACNTVTHKLTRPERRALVLAEALIAITRDGVPAAAVHNCLLALDEYADAMPDDNLRAIPRQPDITKAAAVLVPHPECYQWKVICCPFCGGSHLHGAGRPGEDHDRYLGGRVAHCGHGGGYVLVKAASVPPPPPAPAPTRPTI